MSVREEPWAPGTPSWVDLTVGQEPAAARHFYTAVFGYEYQPSDNPDAHSSVRGDGPGDTIAGIGALDPAAAGTPLDTDALADTDAPPDAHALADTDALADAHAPSPAGEPAAHWQVFFMVDDADAAAATALERGGAVRVPVSDAGYGRQATLADPQGAVFGVMSVNS
jgi:predicted enzyme related to lactoylglutathione lyase